MCSFHFNPFTVKSFSHPDLDASESFGLLFEKVQPLPLRASTPQVLSVFIITIFIMDICIV